MFRRKKVINIDNVGRGVLEDIKERVVDEYQEKKKELTNIIKVLINIIKIIRRFLKSPHKNEFLKGIDKAIKYLEPKFNIIINTYYTARINGRSEIAIAASPKQDEILKLLKIIIELLEKIIKLLSRIIASAMDEDIKKKLVEYKNKFESWKIKLSNTFGIA